MIKKHKYCAFSTKLYKTVSKKIEISLILSEGDLVLSYIYSIFMVYL